MLLLTQTSAPHNWLVNSPRDGFRGNPDSPYFHPHAAPDALFRRYLLQRDAEPPEPGDGWQPRAADEEGWIDAALGSAYASMESETDRVVLARLEGATFLYVNGARFSGDRLNKGFGPVPVALRAGRNDVYVTGVWRRFRLELEEAEQVVVATWATLSPDLVAGQVAFDELVFPIVNASTAPLKSLHVHYGKIPLDDSPPGISEWRDGPVHVVPLGALEQFGYVASERYQPLAEDMQHAFMGLNVYVGAEEAWRARTVVPFAVRQPSEPRRFVFRSSVDGSPQSYVLHPANASRQSSSPRAIVLSLHGTGEDGHDQIAKHPAVPGIWVVAPDGRSTQTTKVDWWGWSWIDAIGALESVLDRLPDGARPPLVYVAAAEDLDLPDAELEPGIVARIPVGAEQGTLPAPTPLGGIGIVAHGSTSRGTVGPYLRVEQLLAYGQRYEVSSYHHGDGRLAITTSNLRRLTVWPPSPGTIVQVDDVDLGELPSSPDGVSLVRSEIGWNRADPPGPAEKRAGHDGPIFDAFDNRFVLVYGTGGDDEEDREILERARADQQRWWALARGLPQLLSDEALKQSAGLDPISDCNVILYGNAHTNGAWERFVGDGPICVQRGLAVVGGARFERDDLCVLFVHPRADIPGSALVAVIAETGPTGARLGYAVNPFDPAAPDYIVLSPEFLEPNGEQDGALIEGWFDHAWQIQHSK